MKDREAWSAADLGVAVSHTVWQLNNSNLRKHILKQTFSIIHCPTYYFFFFTSLNLKISFATLNSVLLLGFSFFSFLSKPHLPPHTVYLSLSFATSLAAHTLKTVNSLSCQFCIIRENCSPFLCFYLATSGSITHLFSSGKKIT